MACFKFVCDELVKIVDHNWLTGTMVLFSDALRAMIDVGLVTSDGYSVEKGIPHWNLLLVLSVIVGECVGGDLSKARLFSYLSSYLFLIVLLLRFLFTFLTTCCSCLISFCMFLFLFLFVILLPVLVIVPALNPAACFCSCYSCLKCY